MSDTLIPSQAPDQQALYFHHWPCKAPRAVISIIHGFGEHGGRYAHMAETLNQQNIAVWAVDLRGHGKTQGPRGVCANYEALIGDVDALLERAQISYPDKPHYLFGHSMGGGLVLAHGFKNPQAKLAGYLVSAPFIKAADQIPAPLRLIVKALRKIMPNRAIAFPIKPEKISTLAAQQHAYCVDPLIHGRLSFGLAVGMYETGERLLCEAQNWPHRLRLWYTPQDKLVCASAIEDFATHAPQCETTKFERSEHEMHNDVTRAQVYKLIADFILQD